MTTTARVHQNRTSSQMSTSDARFYAELHREIAEKKKQRVIRSLEESGLSDAIKRQTFGSFEAVEDWQKRAKTTCMAFADNPDGWLLLSGQSGCGKTHLCTAVVGKLIEQEIPVRYMLYRDEIGRLKQEEPAEREKKMDMFKRAACLYIDDLFKGGVTEADVRIMFELFDYRYRANLTTIVSTELTAAELRQVDDAIAGRIIERARTVFIKQADNRNYRFRKLRRK